MRSETAQPSRTAQPKRARASAAAAWLARQLKGAATDYSRIVERAGRDPELIPALFECEFSPKPRLHYGSAKALWLVADARPDLLYDRFDLFAVQLATADDIVRWNAMRALGCLAAVDKENKIEALLDSYLGAIPGPQMIAAANAIGWAPAIALAKPHLAGRIAEAILGVQTAVYQTPECRNVAIGHAIRALDRFFHLIPDQAAVLRFVRAQLGNTRPATRRKAEKFLGAHAAPKPPARNKSRRLAVCT